MNRIIYSQYFRRLLKRLVKKDPGLLRRLENTLVIFDKQVAVSIGRKLFKIRLPGNSRGKSGGYRLYIYLIESHNAISPILIYSKSEQKSVSPEELTYHLEAVEKELYQFYGWIFD